MSAGLVITDHLKPWLWKLSGREQGQAAAEYAFMLTMLLVLVGLMTLVGLHVERGLSWIGSAIH